MNMGSVGLFTKIDESLEYLKKIKFNDTKIHNKKRGRNGRKK